MFKESLPSVVNDPFKKNKVTRVYVSYSKKWVGEGFDCCGSVEFKNGDTNGEQRFHGETFDEVVLKIKAMLETLD